MEGFQSANLKSLPRVGGWGGDQGVEASSHPLIKQQKYTKINAFYYQINSRQAFPDYCFHI